MNKAECVFCDMKVETYIEGVDPTPQHLGDQEFPEDKGKVCCGFCGGIIDPADPGHIAYRKEMERDAEKQSWENADFGFRP